MKHISIIGVGLIGGSFALDLKGHFPGVYISGIDQNDAHLKEALKLGMIDQTGDLSTVSSESRAGSYSYSFCDGL